MTLVTFPWAHSALIPIKPTRVCRVRWVTGSCMGKMPVSSNTVVAQIELEPDIGGVSSGSIIIHAASAVESVGGTKKLTWQKTQPHSFFSMKFLKELSAAIQARCCQSVSPGGVGTPAVIPSPTSPSADCMNDIVTLHRYPHLIF